MTAKKDRHPFGCQPGRFARFNSRTKFAEEFPCKHGTSFRRICEPDPVRQVARSGPMVWWSNKKARDTFGCPPGRFARFNSRTKFAEEFPCEHGTSFRRICEPDPVRQVARSGPMEWWSNKKSKGHLLVSLAFLEAPPGIGPGIEVLQTFALPLGHGALFN